MPESTHAIKCHNYRVTARREVEINLLADHVVEALDRGSTYFDQNAETVFSNTPFVIVKVERQ